MLTRVCDICGRVIPKDDIVKVEDPKILMSKLNPYNIGITCPRDNDWDLCSSCSNKLYSWVKEQKAAAKESMKECCHEDNNESLVTIHRIRDKIREVRRKINER